MKLEIGKVKLNGNKELSYYFENPKTRDSHSWSGPTVKIADITVHLEVDVAGIAYNTPKDHAYQQGDKHAVVSINRTVVYEITDEQGRKIKRYSNVDKLKHCIESKEFGYPCGWADGPTTVEIKEELMALVYNLNATLAS